MAKKRKGKARNSRKSSSPSSQVDFHLPEECWESIFTFLINGDGDGDDDNNNNNIIYLEPISLTSKHFLSITNRLHRFCLTILNPIPPSFIPTLFRRFPNLTSLHITTDFQSHFSIIVSQISDLPFNLKSLKLSNQNQFPAEGLLALSKKITTLTSLTYSNVTPLNNNDFVLISKCFPLLEELDLQYNTTVSFNIQVGVRAMITALPKLRKFNLSGYDCIDFFLLLYLCKNCEFLEDIVMLNCPLLTIDGIADAICERPTLRSLSFSWSKERINGYDDSDFVDSLVGLKSLSCLDLSYVDISDELFSSIGMEDLPWRRLVLQHCTGYTYDGIFSLLSKCKRIQHLDLKGTNFLKDHHVVMLSSFLANLVSINLSECCELTDSTLLALVRSCLSLSDIKMEHTRIGQNIGKNSNSLTNFDLYPQLKSLYLARCSLLNDQGIIMFASIFPNLQLLHLSNANKISKEGICRVLKRCRKIRHLKLGFCSKVLLGINYLKVLKLEVLNLSYTNVDDETLYVISKNCCGLWQLVLERCDYVTMEGVKHVLENCTKLREINLRYCVNVIDHMFFLNKHKVGDDIVASMVNLRPSLRKIIASTYASDKEFWHLGCHVI